MVSKPIRLGDKPVNSQYLLYFVYTTPQVVFGAAAATLTTTITIDGSSDFRANKMTIGVIQAGVMVTTWPGQIQIDDTGRGRTLFSNNTLVWSIIGNGSQPYYFDPPRLFRRNSTITITLINPVAVATTVEISLHGHKLMDSAEIG